VTCLRQIHPSDRCDYERANSKVISCETPPSALVEFAAFQHYCFLGREETDGTWRAKPLSSNEAQRAVHRKELSGKEMGEF
jgi:hypothetical protein